MTMTALIFEDHPGQGFIFKAALEQVGYKVQLVQNGKLAQDRLAGEVPDLLVLDLHMPGISGEQILKDIKANPRFAETRLIIATGDVGKGHALADQVDLVLFKPIGFDQLKAVARQVETLG